MRRNQFPWLMLVLVLMFFSFALGFFAGVGTEQGLQHTQAWEHANSHVNSGVQR